MDPGSISQQHHPTSFATSAMQPQPPAVVWAVGGQDGSGKDKSELLQLTTDAVGTSITGSSSRSSPLKPRVGGAGATRGGGGSTWQPLVGGRLPFTRRQAAICVLAPPQSSASGTTPAGGLLVCGGMDVEDKAGIGTGAARPALFGLREEEGGAGAGLTGTDSHRVDLYGPLPAASANSGAEAKCRCLGWRKRPPVSAFSCASCSSDSMQPINQMRSAASIPQQQVTDRIFHTLRNCAPHARARVNQML